MRELEKIAGKREMLRFWHAIDEAYSTPITYHPGGWEDTIPAELKELVLLQRLGMIINGGWETATNAEATCYLSTACHVFPFDGDWTDIYCWLVGQFMPVAYQKFDFTPEKLRRDQVEQLEGLKRDIRSKQKSRKKKPKEVTLTTESPESTTFEGTIVIKGSPEGLSVMVGKDNCDPHIQVLDPTTLEEVLEIMPGIITGAEAKWAENPRNPTYTKPKTVRKSKSAQASTAETPASPATGVVSSPAEAPTSELPLLDQADSDSGLEAATSSPESAESNVITGNVITDNVIGEQMEEKGASLLHQSPDSEVVQTKEDPTLTEEQTNVTEEEPSADAPQEFTCPSCDFSAFSEVALEGHFTAAPDHREPTAEEEVPVAATGTSEEAPSTEGEEKEPEVVRAPVLPEATAAVAETPATEGAAASGGDEKKAGAAVAPWVYFLKDTGKTELDGNGPFYNVSDALDALGVPKEGRGSYWHRHDRLPKEHANRIDKRRE